MRTRNRFSSGAVGALILLVASSVTAEDAAPNDSDTLFARLSPATQAGLTSTQVAERARLTSPDVRMRREVFAEAQTRVNEAMAAFLPKLSLLGRYTRLSPITNPSLIDPALIRQLSPDLQQALGSGGLTFPIFLNQWVIQAGLVIPLSDYVLRLSHSYAAASHSAHAALLDQGAAELKTATDARTLYYSWLRARAQMVVAKRSLEQVNAHLVDAQRSLELTTDTTRADVLRIESQVASAELMLERTANLVSLYEQQLRVAMHEPNAKSFEIGEDLRAELPPMPNVDVLEALRVEAIERRLEIRALDQTAWSFQGQARAAAGAAWPQLSAFGDVVTANPNQRYIPQVDRFRTTWDVGVQITWTPNDAFTAVYATSGARSRVAQTDAQKVALRDSICLEVTQAYYAFKEAELAVRVTSRALASAEEGYRVRLELFRNGRATNLELTDAELELARASLSSIDARVDQRIARVQLLHAVGRDAPGATAWNH